MTEKNIIVTDIGSTTTKTLLLKNNNGKYKIVDYEVSPTTVEKPNEDVKIGIINSIRKLEKNQKINILNKDSSHSELSISDKYLFFVTSSAGGGLQILVLGHTLSDSAFFASKTVYGAGGIVAKTLASNDLKTSTEKLFALNNSHPDIILFTGGYDGGALFGIYRLAETLKFSSITQKFTFNSKIPIVFAGNNEAQEFLNLLLTDKFDVFMMPNIRPSENILNHIPTQDKIQEIFMTSVMEYAPGYSEVKEKTCVDILPTPASVLQTLKTFSSQRKIKIMFDIGGATTDIYSNIYGHYFRSVSAGYGMSYNIGNILSNIDINIDLIPYINAYNSVLAEKENLLAMANGVHRYGMANGVHRYEMANGVHRYEMANGVRRYEMANGVRRYGTVEYLQNYIGNKVLYPTIAPIDNFDKYIEHIFAIQGVKMSFEQHLNMHFLEKKNKLIENLNLKKLFEPEYYPHLKEKLIFKLSDIKILIASGGVISNATKEQAIFMMLESFKPQGIVELWRDKHFISPHLGILTNFDKSIAQELIFNDCYEKLAIYIRSKKKNINLFIDEENVVIKPNEFYNKYFPHSKSIKIFGKKFHLEKGVMLIIDTRNFSQKESSLKTMLHNLGAYQFELQNKITAEKPHVFNTKLSKNNYKQQELKISLLYSGDTFVKVREVVKPDTILAENKYEPPKIYIILLSETVGRKMTESEAREGLMIKESDNVSDGQVLFVNKKSVFISEDNQRKLKEFHKKYEGRVYTIPPPTVFTDGLGIQFKPDDKVLSPVKGIVEKISYTTGTILIQSLNKPSPKPYKLHAEAYGVVKSIKDNKDFILNVNAIKIEGKIGFGKMVGGFLKIYDSNSSMTDRIVFKHYLSHNDALNLIKQNVKGVICSFISYSCVIFIIGRDIGVAITGNEEIPFSLIIINGFMESSDQECFIDINHFIDHYVLLMTSTQIRAGVIRPKILIFNETEINCIPS